MIHCSALLIADQIIRDVESGQVSIINVWHSIVADSYPNAVQRAYVLAILEKGANTSEKSELRLEITIGEGKLLDREFEPTFDDKGKVIALFEMRELPLPEQAPMTIKIYEKQNIVGCTTLDLTLRG